MFLKILQKLQQKACARVSKKAVAQAFSGEFVKF